MLPWSLNYPELGSSTLVLHASLAQQLCSNAGRPPVHSRWIRKIRTPRGLRHRSAIRHPLDRGAPGPAVVWGTGYRIKKLRRRRRVDWRARLRIWGRRQTNIFTAPVVEQSWQNTVVEIKALVRLQGVAWLEWHDVEAHKLPPTIRVGY
jgi:hypothetical protein